MMNDEGGILKINIYGSEYPIKGDADTDTEYIMKVAAYVDRKMREIDESTHAKSSLKVAILAALNITDELFQERSKIKDANPDVQDRLALLTQALDKAMNDD